MNGKYEIKKTKDGRNRKGVMWIAILATILVLALAMIITNTQSNGGETTPDPQSSQPTGANQTGKSDSQEMAVTLDEGLEVISIGSYTGVYMEDGSDEVLSNILMLRVVNNGDTTIEYAEIHMVIGEQTAEFSLSTLKSGATIVLLEKNRMAYSNAGDYTSAEIISQNVALFKQPLELQEDKLEFQILDGAINVTNISGQDIPGIITIYYKNAAGGIYYGGITYRIRLDSGIKADEIRQLMATHFSDTGSEIMFVTIAE